MGCLDDGIVLAFTRGELERAELQNVDEHLDSCTTCRQLVVALSSTSDEERAEVVGLRKGDTLGRHVIESMIGKGATGQVYLARDPDLAREVAIKVIAAGSGEELFAEAQAMARLQHPNVVAVHEVGRADDGRVFLVMEHVEGGTLRGWLGGKREPGEVLRVFRDIARGLEAAHNAGVIHRDFKPENVLIDAGGRPRVTDFGLAKYGHGAHLEDRDLTSTRTVGLIGTPAYMAPEQLRGERADELSDQFAFCVALVEGLTGSRPFSGSHMRELSENVLSGRREAPASKLPTAIEHAVDRGLSLEPEERFPHMAAIADALDQGLVPRRRFGIAAAMVAAPIAALGAWVAIASSGEEQQPASAVAVAECAAPLEWHRKASRELRRHLEGAAQPFATASANSTVALIEDRAEELRSRSAERCALGETDPERACLRERAAETELVVASLFTASPTDVVSHSIDWIADLPPVSSCAGISEFSPPSDEVRRLRVEIAAAGAAGAAESQALMERAQSLGALESEAALLDSAANLDAGKYDAAADAAHRAMSRAGNDSRLRARTWLILAAVAGEKGDYKEAARAAEAAAGDLSALSGAADLEIDRLHVLGLIELGQGHLDVARQHLGAAQDRSQALYGVSHRVLARSLSHLGLLAKAEDRLEDSLARHEEALAIERGVYGHGHPALARHHHNIGGVLRRLGRADEARASYLTALNGRRKALGVEHPLVGLTTNSLGLVDLDQSKLKSAESRFERAFEILDAAGDERRARPLTNLGILHQKGGEATRARGELRRARRIWLVAKGEGAPEVLEIDRYLKKHARAPRAQKKPRTGDEPEPKPPEQTPLRSYGSSPSWN